VEIAEDEPFRVEALLRRRSVDSAENQFFELIVREAIFRARANIIETAPEVGRDVILAEISHAAGRILDRSPFQHTAERDMEHNRVEILEDARIEDARLAKRHPVADARFDDDTFGDSFGDSVMIVNRDHYRVASTAPVERFVAVRRL